MDQGPEVDRRRLIAGGLAAGAGLAAATAVGAAPSAAEPRAWAAYERRLRSRLSDAGGGRFDADAEREVLRLTNRVRAQAGAGAVTWHDDLARAARAHAADLVQRGYFEHLSPEGFDPSHRAWLVARRTVGSPSENLGWRRASRTPTAAELMEGWRRSPPHWRNLLRTTHTHAAFGFVRQGDQAWVVGLYARPVALLAEPLPFQPASLREIEPALRSLPEGARVRFGPPQGAAADGGSRVLQLSAERPAGERRYEIVGGPIFLAPGYGRAG